MTVSWKLVICFLAGTFGVSSQILPIFPPLTCQPQAAVPSIVRAEAVSERVGDILVVCSGGTFFGANQPLPMFNIRVYFNANVASRLTSQTFSEALLLIDEPNSPSNPSTPLRVCGDFDTNEAPNNPGVCTVFGSGGENTYSGASNRPNVFQARQIAANGLEWVGVPLDPPGPELFTRKKRTLRFTNLRVNPGTVLVPSQAILAYISFGGGATLNVSYSAVVGYTQPGIAASLLQDVTTLRQCEPRGPGEPSLFTVRVSETFPSSFKKWNSAQTDPEATRYPAVFANQNVPGASYDTEDGFLSTKSALGRTFNDPGQQAFPDIRGLRTAGVTASGTRVRLEFRDIPAGATLQTPEVVEVTSRITGQATGRAMLVGHEANTAAVYEILFADPFDTEYIDVPVSVSTTREAALGIEAKVTAAGSTFSTFTIAPCGCNLLFPVVSNRAGYDTGIAISNTGDDTGEVTLHFFCGGQAECITPATQTTDSPLEPGRQLTFTLSGGGGYGIEGIPGFHGYIIARTRFRSCHGLAYISALNALATSNGASTAYLALVMDNPAPRPGVGLSENLGH